MKQSKQRRQYIYSLATVFGVLLTIGGGSPAAHGQAAAPSQAKQKPYPELAISQYGKWPYRVSASGTLLPLDYDMVTSWVFPFGDPQLLQFDYDESTLYCGGLYNSGGFIEAYRLSPHAQFHDLGGFALCNAPDYPAAMAFGAHGHFLYVLTVRGSSPLQGCILSGFRMSKIGVISPLRGKPLSVGPTSGRTSAMVSSADGGFLYVSNIQNHSISGYKIAANGSLISLPGKAALPQTPSRLFFHPSGRFLYVTSADSSALMKVPVNPNGTLGQPQVVLPGTDRRELLVTMTPDGRFLYTVDYKYSRTDQFRIKSDGSLQPLSPAFVAVLPYAIAVDLTSRFAYLSEKPLHSGDVIRQYQISSTEALLPLAVPVLPAPSDDPVFLTFLRPR